MRSDLLEVIQQEGPTAADARVEALLAGSAALGRRRDGRGEGGR